MKYGIEKCHIKQLLLGIYSLCLYLHPLLTFGKQSVRRNGVCVPTYLSTPATLITLYRLQGKIFTAFENVLKSEI